MSKSIAHARNTGQSHGVWRMPRTFATLALGGLLVLAASTGITSCEEGDVGKVGDDVCLACHDGRFSTDATGLADNIHSLFDLSCEGCHGPGYLHVRNGGRGGFFIDNPSDFGFQAAYDTCQSCHAPIIEQFEQSVHFEKRAANCFDCHNIHRNPVNVLPVEDNSMCLSCHADMEFQTEESLDIHVGLFHNPDPEGTGVGRCTICHMVPPSQFFQDTSIRSHTFRPVEPIETLEAAEAGVRFVPPNTCAGIAGCHDPNVPGSGAPRDVNDLSNIEFLQNAFGLVGGFEE